ncbi:ribosomal protection-like ABC-F family protein [Alkalibacter saccharofermentans]|uniref:ATP-binding cassette, subfamily F, member 3 n=1 Tax=Alkalibacter saccharofermentans DSM 14828 TaxID=1120975 RepID=A0A1M4VBZ5_9FIRM|nr:ABC-F family ATP-binding cassette domain-containing protein [Alkalibacter saccharofermentans]SHE66368.1 ATP-binding cassette, subfamily F, member 3 [Alkalibacter saccharofermentans DSM 14828]
MLVSANNIEKSFGVETVLKNVSFMVDDNSKIGIVGKNGTGKSTLFKIIAGITPYDSGSIDYAKNLSIGYLSQESSLNEDNRLYEEVISVFDHIIDMEREMRTMEVEISKNHDRDVESLLNKYAQLTEKFEDMSGYEYESRARGILIGLGFAPEEFDRPVAAFSGGEKTRISLAKMILTNPQLLLLDEPTNFLDIETIQWLESYLKNYSGSFIIISHDRYFLDSLVTTVFEIENKTLTRYNGNFSEYVRRKQENLESQLHQYKLEQREIQRQEEIIKQFRQFNREKSIKRARSREKMLDKMPKSDKPFIDNRKVSMKFEPKIQSSKLVLEVDDLAKSYDSNLFNSISFNVFRGDRIGIIGANGSGKSTMLKIINGDLSQDRGQVNWGQKVIPAFFRQDNAGLDPDSTVLDEVWNCRPKANEGEIRNILSYFKFYGDDAFKPLNVLSGGELSRVSLARTMLSDANFIIMDEPTNHLDMPTVDVLENALSDYTGTLFIVSHDRYFLNKTVNRLFVLKDNHLEIYEGNYDYYIQKTQEAKMLEDLKNSQPEKTKTEIVQEKKLKNKQKKELAALKKEISRLEESIIVKEEEISKLEKIICSDGFYDDYDYSCKINSDYESAKSQLSLLMDDWTVKQMEIEESS